VRGSERDKEGETLFFGTNATSAETGDDVWGGGRSSEWSCVLPVLIEELLGTSSSDITMLGEESVGST
jgi:hypothetical protein